MTYWNPVERYGVGRGFARRDLADAGGAGLITPTSRPTRGRSGSRPPTRATSTRSSWSRRPRTDERLAMTATACRGFVYATAVMGVTGARSSTSDAGRAARARAPSCVDRPAGRRWGSGSRTATRPPRSRRTPTAVIVGSAFVRALLDAGDDRAAGPARAGARSPPTSPRASGAAERRRRSGRGARGRSCSSACSPPAGAVPRRTARVAGTRRRRPVRHGDDGALPASPPTSPARPPTARRTTCAPHPAPLKLVFFGYTHCPDICQVVMATLAERDDPTRPGRDRDVSRCCS